MNKATKNDDNMLFPNTVIGILGGGQLGRMLSVAAGKLGFMTHIYDPSSSPPAAQLAQKLFTGRFDDDAMLEKFAKSVDVVTYEFENIPLSSLEIIKKNASFHPNIKALAVSQDRLQEKEFLNKINIPTAPYMAVETLDELLLAIKNIGGKGILKTRSFGYDGKGQFHLNPTSNFSEIWQKCNHAPMILEGMIDFSCEISVIAARDKAGAIACYDPGENIHKQGILHKTIVPARVSSTIKNDAILMSGRLLQALDYIGVMGVEFFVTHQGTLLINEFAPRVHNSGHWTQEGCIIDQFEQHIRAITGLALGDGKRLQNIEMTNLIGEDASPSRLDGLYKDPTTALHLYGKTDMRPGRKMGHYNRVCK